MLRSIEARELKIAFRSAFSHASATRNATQSLWVEARDREGRVGYGEGCPREYVTRETVAGTLAFADSQRDELIAAIRDLETLKDWVRAHRARIDDNPAAWCAIELALIDLLARRNDQTVEQLLGLPELAGRFDYSAVLGDATPPAFEAQLARYVEAGFRDFKIKLSGDAARDGAKVAALNGAGVPAARVRADANNLWRDADAAIAFLAGLGLRFAALEEPLQPGDFGGMARVAAAFDCALILDESLLRPRQLDELPASPVRWIANLRISKCGGLLRSLELAQAARGAGLQLVVGAQVGETSLLARAALAVANAVRDRLVAMEGAFGTHLLVRDSVEPSLMFGPGGVLQAAAVPAALPGFGLAPGPCR
jgi:L-alanine-DL-glutamate epimerase-like enolase superfamily enzyme